MRPIPESQPTVVELQTDNDTATHNVFPIGTTRRNVSGVGRLSTEADYDQRSRRSVRHMLSVNGEFPILAHIQLENRRETWQWRYLDLPGRPRDA